MKSNHPLQYSNVWQLGVKLKINGIQDGLLKQFFSNITFDSNLNYFPLLCHNEYW